jgi:hypothetical protein
VSEAVATGRFRVKTLTGALAAAAYVVLGSILCWSRLAGLDRGYASDELMTVTEYVRAGLREILVGTYIPNNHELFSILGWMTTSALGESEVALRLWSAVPFVIGVILVTAWLHSRLGALSGVLFLFLATFSPLLLDITRQARGYGLAFLAMSVLTVAALEAIRSPSGWSIAAFSVAGLVGTWTLPNFGIAFAATGAVLLANRDLRRSVAVGLTLSLGAVAVVYAPHVDDLLESSRQQYGARIDGAWIVTAPIDQALLPALEWIDETLLDPGLASLALVVALALVISSSPLLRRRDTALVLCAGVVATVVTLWLTRTNVAPRFLSFLLVPLFVLLATGLASVLARFGTTVRPGVRTVLAAATIGLFAIVSVPWMADITRLPREAVRDVAEVIRTDASPSAPVLAYIPYPRDLELQLGRPVEPVRTPAHALRVCEARRDVVFVAQPWILPPVSIPCTERAGARHYRFEQYARGGAIDVWLIPARS